MSLEKSSPMPVDQVTKIQGPDTRSSQEDLTRYKAGVYNGQRRSLRISWEGPDPGQELLDRLQRRYAERVPIYFGGLPFFVVSPPQRTQEGNVMSITFDGIFRRPAL